MYLRLPKVYATIDKLTSITVSRIFSPSNPVRDKILLQMLFMQRSFTLINYWHYFTNVSGVNRENNNL